MSNYSKMSQEVTDLLASLSNYCCNVEDKIRCSITLSPVEFRVLSNININYPVNASEFSKCINISPSRTSRVIEKLEKDSYISVERDPRDRRTAIISITDKGIEAQQLIIKMREECRVNLDKSLSEEEMIIFTQIGNKIINQ